MDTGIRYVLIGVFCSICFIFSSSTYAKSILSIIPTTTTYSIKLTATGRTTILYTVTNNTQRPINAITIDPYYGNLENQLTLMVENNNCIGTLTPSTSCTFELLIQGNGQPTSSVLMPRVCGFNGAICSTPILNNRIAVISEGTSASIAYVLNASGLGFVSICPINTNDGSLETCTNSNGEGTFNTPFGMSINTEGTAAYIVNFGSSTISICSIAQDGTGFLNNCTTSDGNSTFNSPSGVSLNSANTYLYVVNNSGDTISICPVIQQDSSFSLGSCTTTTGNGTFSGGLGPQAISFNADSTYAYIPCSAWVSICAVLQDGSGGFGTCIKVFDPTFIFPQGISFNATATYAYVGNYTAIPQSGTVSVCPILQDGSGTFGPCTSTNGNQTFDFSSNDIVGLSLRSPSYYGYIPNNGSDTVSICPINIITNQLDFCTTTNGNGMFSQPTAIAISYAVTNS